MKQLLWVRLVFRAMGVLLIGMALPGSIQFLGQLVAQLEPSQQSFSIAANGWAVLYALGWGCGAFAQLGLGIYLLFYGKRLREWCMRNEEGHCPRCDYELGAGIVVCPECGLPLREVPPMPPRPESP